MEDVRLKSIDEFLALFSREKPIGQDKWEALCPAHSDHEPSLHIRLADHKILIDCKAGCSPNAIVQAVGLTMSALFLDDHRAKVDFFNKEIVCTYPYHNALGQPIYEVVRFTPKSFSQRRMDPSAPNGYQWGLRGVAPVLYHLPEVLKAIVDGTTIAIAEGEKDVDNLRSLGFTATCNPMGAGKWRPSYTESLKGIKQVAVFVDNDAPGRKHAKHVATSLHEMGIAVKVVEMPEPGIKDITHWLEAKNLTAENITAIIDAAPPWTPDTSTFEDNIPVRYNRTDLGNAERLVAQHGDDALYCYEHKSWLIWKGTHWHWDQGGEIMRFAQKTARSIYEEAAREDDDDERRKIADWAKASESNMRLNAMVSQAQPLLKISPDRLDANQWLFNCLNGTIDLRTGELRQHDKQDYITVVAPVEYDPNARSAAWKQFLVKVTDNNANLMAYLQRCAGYTLTGDTSEQCMFFAHGSGMNGKSTFLETLGAIMQPYAVQANIEMFLTSFKPSTSGHSEDLASLAGRRLVTASEPQEGRRLATAKLKQMTGGEHVRASHKHEREFEYVVTYKVWLNANHKPDITDTTYAIWRRVKLIPFTVTIPPAERIKDMATKMRSEHPAILAWAVQGCLDWQQTGLAEPIEVIEATGVYQQESDILAEFIEARCVFEPHNAECYVTHRDLYGAYQTWCGDNSVEPVTSRTFSKNLKEKGTALKFTGRGQIKWRFIRLLKEREERPERVDEVDKVDDFPSFIPYIENIENNIGNCPSSSTPDTKLKTSSTREKTEGPGLTRADAQEMLRDFLGMEVAQMVSLWERSGKPQVILSDNTICDDLGALLLRSEQIRMDDIGVIGDFLTRLKNAFALSKEQTNGQPKGNDTD